MRSMSIGPIGDAAHVRVAEHVVHVVGGEDPGEQRLEVREPARMRRQRLGVALPHQVADPLRVDDLPGAERPARAAAEPTQQIRELLADDALPDQLMRQVVVDQKVVVEEVAERPVPDVVEQPRGAQQLFDQRRRGRVGEDRAQRRIELLGQPPGQMHRAERMLEAAMLRRRVHPARRLQLGHAPQPLHPRGVDQVLLGRLAGHAARTRVENVLMDGVGDEAAPLVGSLGILHRTESTPPPPSGRSGPRPRRTGSTGPETGGGDRPRAPRWSALGCRAAR